jgi:broad specificity phosphatase PhoE
VSGNPASGGTPSAARASTRVCLVRHGEVEAAHKGRFYGGAEVPLSELGVQASLDLAAELARQAPQRVYSSPLSRAAFLGRAIAELSGASLVIEPAFRELDRGDWTHLSRAEVEARWPGALQRSVADPERHAAHGGERESELSARVHEALARAVAADPGGRLIVVTHAHVVRVVMRGLLGWDAPLSMTRFIPYHGLVELEFDAHGAGRVVAAPPGISLDVLVRP